MTKYYLGDPFNGLVFDQMFSQATDFVLANLQKAKVPVEWNDVYSVMSNTLDAVAFKKIKSYEFGGDNTLLVSSVANVSGVDYVTTETIISESYTDSATGDIPAWYMNPADLTKSVTDLRANWELLKPSFLQRVAGTIFGPLGISGEQAIMYMKVLVLLVALVAVAYVIRAFKR